ncbi:MAG: tetratricopeptide repeat protein [Cytophagaceae bacterium]|jgi:tetratricopeptide (TPR) repeat protein|nr:tetratricopeptide repeat protein [Cytophagaceae bacterium]
MYKKLLFTAILQGLISAAALAQIDTDRMIIIGRNALYFEDYILGIRYFNQVITAKPYLADPYYYRAIGKYNLDDMKGAEQDCTSALELNPYFTDAYNLRGITRQRLGFPREALDDFERGLKIDPSNINIITNTGISYIRLKDYAKAIESYNRAIQLSPNLISAYLNRGLAKMAATDTVGATSDFSKAIAINPYIPDGFINRSIVYYQTGEFEKSLADMDKSIELRPNDARLYMNRGIVRYQLDNLKGTVEDFDKVIELEPRNALAYSNRGILRAQIGDLNRAIEDFSRVLALQSGDLLTLYNRALLYAETGQWHEAVADYNIIIDNHPDFAPAYYARSQAKQMTGDEYGASLDYGTAVKLEMARREHSTSDEQTLAQADKKKDDNAKTEGRKATRKESDTDIRNYDKIAVLDDFETEQIEDITNTNPLRGRIQNRNIIVEMEPVFCLTLYPGDTLVHRLRYFDIEVDRFNRKKISEHTVAISNRETELTRETSAQVFAAIEKVNRRLEKASMDETESLYMLRALFYSAVLNLNSAMDDYNRVVELNPENYLAWFNRACTRFRMVEIVKELEAETPEQKQELRMGAIGVNTAQKHDNDSRILDYDLVSKDLEKALELNPNFAFAHYNLGMLHCILRDFEEGIARFTSAIQCNADFAEAWYNRGLTSIYLGREVEGTLDLSKSGELGIFKAYNVIKRYGYEGEDFEEEEE